MMKNRTIKKIALVSISLLMASTLSFAKESIKVDRSKLIDIAGKQRMLSQRIAKDYIYVGKKVATSKADKQLKASLSEFLKIHNELTTLINDPEIQNLLDFVSLSSNELKETANKDFSLDNAHLILDLTESMLEGNQYIVDSLKSTYKIKESDILEKAAKQRMLSQRIAKYYIAYQSGIKDENTVNSMKETVKQFSENLNILMANKHNNKKINMKLKEIDKLWKIVHKFYNNIEKGGLPLIVFNTTDNITKKMDDVTKLYIQKDK
jgi:hypothetical protein